MSCPPKQLLHWSKHIRQLTAWPLIVLAVGSIGCQQNNPVEKQSSVQSDVNEQKPIALFDGLSMEGWQVTNFGGEREVNVVDGEIRMDQGYPISGINRSRNEKLPTSNYEISLEAKRLSGIDFFCLLTFPVNESHCSFVVAGWAGATVGLSCVDGKDASDNETTQYMEFKNDRWYKIRVSVTDEAITCWIDDKEVVHQSLAEHEFSVRTDVGKSRPLGISAFECDVVYRNIMLTILDDQQEKE